MTKSVYLFGHFLGMLSEVKVMNAASNVLIPTLQRSTIGLGDIGREPFRIFFPAGVIAGIVGVLLWPLYFWGVTQFYPGLTHPRIMAFGLFGGFIIGFLGTAMPRMLSAHPFRAGEVISLLLLHLSTVTAYALSKVFIGDLLFLVLLAMFFVLIGLRIRYRRDIPPPGFVLVGLSLACVAAGSVLAVLQNFRELDTFWILLQRLLCYQAFILLPILGIGPFILPRFFGMPNHHDFPEMNIPSAAWMKKAGLALGAGLLIVGSFAAEAAGWLRSAYAIRFATTLVYLFLEMPFHRAPKGSTALGLGIRAAFVFVLAGFLTVALFPAYRMTLLHLTLIGGFAVVTFVVATRVVFGHSGNIARLKERNRWLPIAIGIMVFAMATRMSGDFWPKLMVSHYVYGAILWIIGVLLWSAYVLPKVLVRDTED